MASDSVPDSNLSPSDRERLGELLGAESLADLTRIMGTESEHDAYFDAKREWQALWEKCDTARPQHGDLPGELVVIDDHRFWVHGVTHADTDAERKFLRNHVRTFLDAGATIYCEQGIRSMYFSDFPSVCEMDDYSWAMDRIKDLDMDSHLDEVPGPEFDGVVEEVNDITSQFQDAAFALIDSGSDLYGDAYSRALGDVASYFLTSHEDMATGDDFVSFSLSRQAALTPEKLPELQAYYRKAFLPQPVEREWLRRHDRELELVTHARNERMADYSVFHNEDASTVHLIVGAAHQPGTAYYLDQYRTGRKDEGAFEPTG